MLLPWVLPWVAFAGPSHAAEPPGVPALGRPARIDVPDVVLTDQRGERRHVMSELIAGRVAVVSFIFTGCSTICSSVGANMGELDRLLGSNSPAPWSHWKYPREVVLNVAIEHRLMHAETLAYILHQLPFERKSKQPSRGAQQSSAFIPGSAVRIPSGEAVLGLRPYTELFGWDNEFNEHTVHVPEFTIDQYKVTNGEFLRFVEAGGYSNNAWWTADDWAWRSSNGIVHPAFWVRRGDTWSYRAMFHELPLPLDWPVYVSHAEASAYARWAGKRLPTEAQWQLAASGSAAHAVAGAWDPAPVNHCEASVSAFGVKGLFGNGWEWTSTEFAPFPGFRPFACYPGYSEPFFDGRHYVLKGGSVRTAQCMLRPSFRNWFQPHYQYTYSGFRCVANRRD